MVLTGVPIRVTRLFVRTTAATQQANRLHAPRRRRNRAQLPRCRAAWQPRRLAGARSLEPSATARCNIHARKLIRDVVAGVDELRD